jgi:hypothetical protein
MHFLLRCDKIVNILHSAARAWVAAIEGGAPAPPCERRLALVSI